MDIINLSVLDPKDSEIQLILNDKEKIETEDPNNELHKLTAERSALEDSFRYICGINPDTINVLTNKYWTESEMIDAMNDTRAFMKTDLVKILNLSGVMADINSCLFTSELKVFSVSELEGYAKVFQLNMDVDHSISREARRILLEGIIIEFIYWSLDRLRMWKWQEEVLFNHAGSNHREYPGYEIIPFEDASTILERGPSDYYSRVGSTTRDWLLTRFNYFDLAHMAGVLGLGTKTPLILTNETSMIIIADLILRMLDELSSIDSRAFLTPLGPYMTANKEDTEVLYNFNIMNPVNHDLTLKKSELFPIASKAGISLYVCSKNIHDTDIISADINEGIDIVTDKPTYAVAEELMEQYMSKQFYIGVESSRDYINAIETVKTLSGTMIDEFQRGQILFFGVGDGDSKYLIYELSELETIFRQSEDYFDPYSVAKNPENQNKWRRFSPIAIKRLRNIVLPKLHIVLRRMEPEWHRTLVALEMSIVNIEKKRRLRIQKLPSVGKLYQLQLINTIRYHVSNDPMVAEGVLSFVVFLFNLGTQFSDWEVNFDRNPEDKDEEIQRQTIDRTGHWQYLEARQSIDMQDKIVMMVTYEIEKFINVKTDKGEIGPFLRQLSLIKFYGDRYCSEFDDELNTLENRFRLIVNAVSMGYLDFIRTSGNWLMASAKFYQQVLLDGLDLKTLVEIQV
jgi:hypothetical protein